MCCYLIIKLGAIGDVAMATTMASELRRANPSARLTWVVGSAAKPLLQAMGIVDEIITANEEAILHGSLAQKMRAVWSVWRSLGRRKFDVCLIPYRDWRYHILRAGVHCKEVRSFRHDVRGPHQGAWPHLLLQEKRYCVKVCYLYFDNVLRNKI